MSATVLKVRVSECVLVHMGSLDIRGCASCACACMCTCVCALIQGVTGLGSAWGHEGCFCLGHGGPRGTGVCFSGSCEQVKCVSPRLHCLYL